MIVGPVRAKVLLINYSRVHESADPGCKILLINGGKTDTF